MIWLGVPVAHPLCIIRPNRYLSKATAEGGLTHNSDGIKSGVPFTSPDIFFYGNFIYNYICYLHTNLVRNQQHTHFESHSQLKLDNLLSSYLVLLTCRKDKKSFLCYSQLCPRVIQPSFDAQSLCRLHSDCSKTYTCKNVERGWKLRNFQAKLKMNFKEGRRRRDKTNKQNKQSTTQLTGENTTLTSPSTGSRVRSRRSLLTILEELSLEGLDFDGSKQDLKRSSTQKAWLEHDACQLQAVEQIFFGVIKNSENNYIIIMNVEAFWKVSPITPSSYRGSKIVKELMERTPVDKILRQEYLSINSQRGLQAGVIWIPLEEGSRELRGVAGDIQTRLNSDNFCVNFMKLSGNNYGGKRGCLNINLGLSGASQLLLESSFVSWVAWIRPSCLVQARLPKHVTPLTGLSPAFCGWLKPLHAGLKLFVMFKGCISLFWVIMAKLQTYFPFFWSGLGARMLIRPYICLGSSVFIRPPTGISERRKWPPNSSKVHTILIH
ncbi:hypothetical protein VP01_3929g1 [Puccinia sorghi]|uniref:Uncharacterized protein n=1 Tax=Puccinia sorghi TaxID=27349 RepID=A0A0L6USI5_9BASI|nr:hypothetical protein VP01_3929g1 [Puccinia sorghi]